ncbi:MAG: hypothetical protein KBB32_05455 [Spirochaetia bacterium]|nr:hypothetical protein [Spirochaetia bacterium]
MTNKDEWRFNLDWLVSGLLLVYLVYGLLFRIGQAVLFPRLLLFVVIIYFSVVVSIRVAANKKILALSLLFSVLDVVSTVLVLDVFKVPFATESNTIIAPLFSGNEFKLVKYATILSMKFSLTALLLFGWASSLGIKKRSKMYYGYTYFQLIKYGCRPGDGRNYFEQFLRFFFDPKYGTEEIFGFNYKLRPYKYVVHKSYFFVIIINIQVIIGNTLFLLDKKVAHIFSYGYWIVIFVFATITLRRYKKFYRVSNG